jgi:hypothetical protein
MKQLRFSLQCLGLALLCLQAHVGCSLIVDADTKQCSTDKDCKERGVGFAGGVCIKSICQRDPQWACVENVSTTSAQASLNATFSVLSMISFGPMPGVHGAVCGNLDLACQRPLGEADSDADGNLTLPLPQSFSGYIKLESEGTEPMLFFPRLPIKNGDEPQLVFLSPKGAMKDLAGLLGDNVDETRGFAVMLFSDCQEKFAAGITMEIMGATAGSHLYYSFNGSPSSTATSTDETGMVGVLNAIPGTLGVRFKRGEETLTETSVLVRQGYMSYRAVFAGDPIPEGFVPQK